MNKSLLSVAGAVVLSLTLAALALAQTPTTTTVTTQTGQATAVQNPDGTWTVVEYPVNKELTVDLVPATQVVPRARILRSANGTTITIDPAAFAGLPNGVNLYAIDAMGHPILLGPINTASTAPLVFNTTLDKFMLVLSPEASLTAYSPSANIVYRSAAPQGLAIVPLARTGEGPGAATGEKVAAVASPTTPTTTTVTAATPAGNVVSTTSAPNYNVPMLGIPSLPVKKETEVKVNYTGSVHVNRTDFFITPNFNNKGTTRVKAKFHELANVPKGAFLTLWAVSPDGKFLRLGTTPNQGSPNVATIDTDVNNTNVPFSDFGLFLTVEPSATAVTPTGVVIGNIIR